MAQDEKKDDVAAREQRLAAALRQNLRKRKLQKARREPAAEAPDPAPATAAGEGGVGRGR